MPNPVPKGFGTVTPFLTVTDHREANRVSPKSLRRKVHFRMDAPDGSVRHAEVKIGDSIIMIGQAAAGQEMHSMLHFYVPDTDALYQSALAAGAVSIREPTDQFYGDRSAGVHDSWGNQWWMATHVEDVSQQEMERRMAAMSTRAN